MRYYRQISVLVIVSLLFGLFSFEDRAAAEQNTEGKKTYTYTTLPLDENLTDEQGLVYELDKSYGYAAVKSQKILDRTEIHIPDRVISDGVVYVVSNVAVSAFNSCDMVKTLYLPETIKKFNLTSLNDSGCETVYCARGTVNLYYTKPVWGDDMAVNNSIKEIVVPEENPYMMNYNGVVLDKEKTEVIVSPMQKKNFSAFTLPDTVCKVDDYAFFRSKISALDTSNLYYVGYAAFSKSKVQPTDLRRAVMIDERAFYDCSNIDTLKVWEGVQYKEQTPAAEVWQPSEGESASDMHADIVHTLDDDNRDECGVYYSLKNDGTAAATTSDGEADTTETVIIPDYVEKEGEKYVVTSLPMNAIGEDTCNLQIGKRLREINALSGMPELEGITVDEANAFFEVEDSALYSRNKQSIYRYFGDAAGTFELPETVWQIGEHAFWKSAISELDSWDNVIEIGYYAFQESKIKHVFAPRVKTIGKDAFRSCYSLESAVFDYANVGLTAFASCVKLKCIYANMLLSTEVSQETLLEQTHSLQCVYIGEQRNRAFLKKNDSDNLQFVYLGGTLPLQLTVSSLQDLYVTKPSQFTLSIPTEKAQNLVVHMTASTGSYVETNAKSAGAAVQIESDHEHTLETVVLYDAAELKITAEKCSECGHLENVLAEDSEGRQLGSTLEINKADDLKTQEPTTVPTGTPAATDPAVTPTGTPDITASPSPSASPSGLPVTLPTTSPTALPSGAPDVSPTVPETPNPSQTPEPSPIESPETSGKPTETPTGTPDVTVTPSPSASPSGLPVTSPTTLPSGAPDVSPTVPETPIPSQTPAPPPIESPEASGVPTETPTGTPSAEPTVSPDASPEVPETPDPTQTPEPSPIESPEASGVPTETPDVTMVPSPSANPSSVPTILPETTNPSQNPLPQSSEIPSIVPSDVPKATKQPGNQINLTKKIVIKYIKRPTIAVKKKKDGKISYLEIVVKKYKGKYIDLYYTNTGKRFKKITKKKLSIKKFKGRFKIRLLAKNSKIGVKARTWMTVKKKKRYSKWSVIKWIRI